MRVSMHTVLVHGGRFFRLIGALSALGMLGASPFVRAESSPVSTATATESEGLVRVDVRGVDEVYVRKGADLGAYRKVMLEPIDVSFQRGWDPHPAGTPFTAREKQEIRQGLALVLRDEFMAELGIWTLPHS